MKIFGAIVAGCWVVSPQWITESFQKGNFLPENRYGTKHPSLKGKKIFMTNKFTKEDKSRTKYNRITYVLEIGGLLFVSNEEEAEYVLVGEDETKEDLPKAQLFTMNAWIDFVLGGMTGETGNFT
eukprot:TRINITY_DN1221_c0_g2_i1.p1 TRINITY_DN1221_c0_g2~~TRINITY_DN1221_c0_g2_i1.p1  ORF type:complete len:125 (+),score=25.67 TRINITY_DN1221_c0_g2_i1:867-1241(+)